jgi:cysteate synthase
VTFNGRWDEIGARTETGTFKDYEAAAVLARFPAKDGRTLVVASAGNTAKAFVKAASDNGLPLVAVVPESCLGELWTIGGKGSGIFIVAASGGADYLETIRLAELICGIPGFHSEGGAKNVARRDGLGVGVLSAAEEAGEIPDYYFQAVGSGTGAIAAHEANLRLNESGSFSPKTMRLVISQNAPFTPILDAWSSGSRALVATAEAEARAKIEEIDAKTLSNRNPPYGLVGGLFDCLEASRGEVVAATNAEARAAQSLFREVEGCDISPEAGVAVASLAKKAAAGEISGDALVMLNITGGGYERLRNDPSAAMLRPDLVVEKDEFDPDRFLDAMARL